MLTVTISCAPKQNNDEMDELLSKYTEFTLTTDLDQLSENEKKMIPLLIEAGKEMNKVFWLQAYGEKGDVYASLSEKEKVFFNINYVLGIVWMEMNHLLREQTLNQREQIFILLI